MKTGCSAKVIRLKSDQIYYAIFCQQNEKKNESVHVTLALFDLILSRYQWNQTL